MTGKQHMIGRAMLLALATWPLLAAAQSQSPKASAQNDEQVFAVASIDVLPQMTARGHAILRDYLAKAKSDKRIVKVWFLDEISTPNHFEIIELFASRRAHDDHVAADYVVAYRDKLHPVLGSPYDERLFSDAGR